MAAITKAEQGAMAAAAAGNANAGVSQKAGAAFVAADPGEQAPVKKPSKMSKLYTRKK
ncbi:MAG TPA: hypothetical protein PLO16_12655 [Acidocella sp.]|nr:hypothetical protein [Acidocella sp.]